MKMNWKYWCNGRVLFLSVLFMLPCSPVQASKDGDNFREIYAKEWAFRLKEFPMFASSFLTSDTRQIMTQLLVLVFGSKYRDKVIEAFKLLDR